MAASISIEQFVSEGVVSEFGHFHTRDFLHFSLRLGVNNVLSMPFAAVDVTNVHALIMGRSDSGSACSGLF